MRNSEALLNGSAIRSSNSTELMENLKSYIISLPNEKMFALIASANFAKDSAVAGDLYSGKHFIIGYSATIGGVCYSSMLALKYNASAPLLLAAINNSEWSLRFKPVAFQN